MEWLKSKSLKQSFFIISSLFLCAGLILSIVSFMLCVNLRTEIETYPKYEITLDESGNAASFDNTNPDMKLVDMIPVQAYQSAVIWCTLS